MISYREEAELVRHEAKYIIPPQLVPEIRKYLKPFCSPDAYGKGDPPEYTVITLQLDTADLALHHAKENDSTNRFKLRIRTYGDPGSSVFLEVKRKVGAVIVKTRARVPRDRWSGDLLHRIAVDLPFKSDREYRGFLTFLRLTREMRAEPVVKIRYIRESYFGELEDYARVSFDRCLQYQPTRSWDVACEEGRWLSIDSDLTQNKLNAFSGVVLELKTLNDAPHWMVDLTREFGLVRGGHCKYSNAIWNESLFRGTPTAPVYAPELFHF